MKEHWRPVKGYEDAYEVSDLGNVRSLDRYIFNGEFSCYQKKGIMLKACKMRNGYMVVNLCHPTRRLRETSYVHRLVATAFISDIPSGMTVNHRNGDKTDNRLENLEIVTYSDNMKHAYRVLKRRPSFLGVFNHGSSKPVAQIKNGKVIAVFPSAREAERQTGIPFKSISKSCHSTHRAGGFHWTLRLTPRPFL